MIMQTIRPLIAQEAEQNPKRILRFTKMRSKMQKNTSKKIMGHFKKASTSLGHLA